MTKEQIMLFDAKLEKMVDHHYDLVYFEGFKDAIQFLTNKVFHDAERGLYKMDDHTMRYPFTRLLFNMKDVLEEKLVDELFRRMDQTIEGYKEEEEPEEEEDYLIDPGEILPDSNIDFMNIGGNEDD